MSGASPTGSGAGEPAPVQPSVDQRRRPVAFCVFLLLAAAVFSALGLWQVERRAWKHDLIARVDARIHAPAVTAPGPQAWPLISAETSEYLRVSARGRFVPGKAALVQAVTALGPGFWFVVPFETDQGFTILVNRGYVPGAWKDPVARTDAEPAGEVTVSGLLRLNEPGGGFLRSNDPAGDRWFSRDVTAIAAARGLGQVAPYFIDADATLPSGRYPAGGLTVVAFPDNHLVYALTWFAMALLSAGTAVFLWRRSI